MKNCKCRLRKNLLKSAKNTFFANFELKITFQQNCSFPLFKCKVGIPCSTGYIKCDICKNTTFGCYFTIMDLFLVTCFYKLLKSAVISQHIRKKKGATNKKHNFARTKLVHTSFLQTCLLLPKSKYAKNSLFCVHCLD